MIERRNLLRMSLGLMGAAAFGVLPETGLAKPARKAVRHAGKKAVVHRVVNAPRRVSFRHLHTGENLEAVFWEKGEYVPDALKAINHLLRDFRTEEEHPIDLKLLDLLDGLRARTGTKEPFRIISAFRSSSTNDALREASAEAHEQVAQVAKKSLHMDGQAMDLRLNDVALTRLHATAVGMKRGGVGFYPDSDFIHVDTGAVRYWQGS